MEEMWKENLNVCLKCFYKFARRKGGTYCKIPSTKSITAAIDRYLRSLPHHKPFSNISDHAFTEANSILDIFAKDLERQSLEKQSRKSSWRNYEIDQHDATNQSQGLKEWKHRPGRLYVGRWNERVRAKRCDAVDWGLLKRGDSKLLTHLNLNV